MINIVYCFICHYFIHRSFNWQAFFHSNQRDVNRSICHFAGFPSLLFNASEGITQLWNNLWKQMRCHSLDNKALFLVMWLDMKINSSYLCYVSVNLDFQNSFLGIFLIFVIFGHFSCIRIALITKITFSTDCSGHIHPKI